MGILDDGGATGGGDRGQARRPVIEGAGQDDPNEAGAIHVRGGSEQRIHRRADVVLAWPLDQRKAAVRDDQVMVHGRDIDVSGSWRFAVPGVARR